MSDFHKVCTIKIFVLKDGIALIYVNIPLHQQALVSVSSIANKNVINWSYSFSF